MSSEEKNESTCVESDEYFKSYEDLEIHKLMLEDHPRNLAYRTAIMNNSSFFKDKVVMDVGTGTGFLAVLCAKAGARKVYAVEASKELAKYAEKVVKENDCDGVVEVLPSRVEEVVLPAGELVDAIVSEWMGFYLLHEGMLDSVLYARDHFLKPDGHLFPESATIYAAPCRLPSLFEAWEDVAGVRMSCVGASLRGGRQHRPEVSCAAPEDLIAREEPIAFVSLREDKLEDLESFSLTHVAVAYKDTNWQGLCVWFDCTFPELSGAEGPVTLSTAPFAPPTHWKQTALVFQREVPVEKGEPMAFQVEIKRCPENRRRYNLSLSILDPETTDHPTPCGCHMTRCIIIQKFIQQHPSPEELADEPVTRGSTLEELDPEYYSGSDSD